MGVAFLSHESACEVLRHRGLGGQPWPGEPRTLPVHGDCLYRQREIKRLWKEADLPRLGLAKGPLDVLVPSSSMRTRGKQARVHVWSGLIPAGSMLRVAPTVVVSGPELVLLQASHIHVSHWEQDEAAIDGYIAERAGLRQLGIDLDPSVENLRLWERTRRIVHAIQTAMEFMGSYRVGGATRETAYGLAPIMTVASMEALLLRLGPYRANAVVSDVLGRSLPHSASPRETNLALMLTLPTEMGGFGLPRPALNETLVLDGEEGPTPDLLWAQERLIVEYDSDEHHRARGAGKLDSDIARANALRAAGYTVLEATPGLVRDLSGTVRLASQVATLLGTMLVVPGEEGLMLRRRLHAELLGT